MTNLIGQSIGRYHITEQLGQGGMATVYKAFDTRLECDVAIKFIRKEKLTAENAEKALKRFTIEAKKTAQLSHPNIVAITDYGEHDSTPYLVMKYIAGNTLKQKLGQPIHWGEAARLLVPIARALEYAHQHKVVHRDVKPANILLTEDGEPMLSDFGIAKVLEVSEETGTLTGTGMGVGTPQYMAPEQASGKKVDHRADIYALGVVFYEMVTGNRPYDADTPLAVIIKQASDPLPPPKQFVRDLPEGVERVIFKALAKDPVDRFQSMTEFAATLEMIAQGKKIRASGKDIQRRLMTVSAIAGVVIVLVMLAFFLNDQIAQGKLSLASISLPQLAQVGQSPTPSSTPTFDLIVAAQRIQAATQTQVQGFLLTRYAQETIIALTPTTTPTITLTPTRTLTPTPTRTLFPTSVPQLFYVPGDAEGGVKFVAKVDGVYRFTIVSGAINCCNPTNPNYGWVTRLNIYINRDFMWNTQPDTQGYFQLIDPDLKMGFDQKAGTVANAESIVRGTFKEFSLRQNEFLWFIYADARYFFHDNSGGIMLSITIVDALP